MLECELVGVVGWDVDGGVSNRGRKEGMGWVSADRSFVLRKERDAGLSTLQCFGGSYLDECCGMLEDGQVDGVSFKQKRRSGGDKTKNCTVVLIRGSDLDLRAWYCVGVVGCRPAVKSTPQIEELVRTS